MFFGCLSICFFLEPPSKCVTNIDICLKVFKDIFSLGLTIDKCISRNSVIEPNLFMWIVWQFINWFNSLTSLEILTPILCTSCLSICLSFLNFFYISIYKLKLLQAMQTKSCVKTAGLLAQQFIITTSPSPLASSSELLIFFPLAILP